MEALRRVEAWRPGVRVGARQGGGEAFLVVGPAESLPAFCGAVGRGPELVYMDPPFLSGRDFFVERAWRGEGGDAGRARRWAYGDRWDHPDAYFRMLEGAFAAAVRALAPEGSLLVHVDPKVAPRVAGLLDAALGEGDRYRRGDAPGFRNELVWSYGLGGSSRRFWARKHDTLFWYTRGSNWFYEPPLVPARSSRMRGQMKKATDVLDVPAINNMAHERTGYPTQKPLALLELLVGAHARPGACVADPFLGSGTTAVAAVRSGRPFVGGDLAWEAVATARDRVVELGAAVDVWASDGERERPNAEAGGLVREPAVARWRGDAPASWMVEARRGDDGALVVERAWKSAPGGEGREFVRGADEPRDIGTHLLVRDASGTEFLSSSASP